MVKVWNRWVDLVGFMVILLIFCQAWIMLSAQFAWHIVPFSASFYTRGSGLGIVWGENS